MPTFSFSDTQVALIQKAAAAPPAPPSPSAPSAPESAEPRRLAACIRRTLRAATFCAWATRRLATAGAACWRRVGAANAPPPSPHPECEPLLPDPEPPRVWTIRETSILEAELARVVVPREARTRLVWTV